MPKFTEPKKSQSVMLMSVTETSVVVDMDENLRYRLMIQKSHRRWRTMDGR